MGYNSDSYVCYLVDASTVFVGSFCVLSGATEIEYLGATASAFLPLCTHLL